MWVSAAVASREHFLQMEQMGCWILDVEGTRLVIDAASFEGTSEANVEEMRTMVESLPIEP